MEVYAISLPTHEAARRAAAELAAEGFRTDEQAGHDGRYWVLQVSITPNSELHERHAVEKRLEQVASAFGGDYLGFGGIASIHAVGGHNGKG